MKQIEQIIRYTLIAMIMLSTSYSSGQNLNNTDYPFVYGYDEPYPYYSPKASDIYPIQLYPVLDEITLRKKPEIQEEDLETLVKIYLPDALFDWKTYQDNVCMVKAGSDISDGVIDGLLKEDAIEFLYRNFIRKIYKELMDIFPVKEIGVYGFRGRIQIRYLNKETVAKADSLIRSKGLETLTVDSVFGRVAISKDLDIIAVANELHESDYLDYAWPINGPVKIKTLNTQPIDKSTLPFYYDTDCKKHYLYELFDRFMVRKSHTLSKSALESVIKGQLEESEIIWINDSLCTVVTNPEQVKSAMAVIHQEDGVLRVSHEYFGVGEYESCLKEGAKNPEAFGFTGVIELSFKNDITEAEKAKLISDYNLKLVGGIADLNYWKYEVPNTSDVLTVSNSVFETGFVEYSRPLTSLYIVHQIHGIGSTTKVKGTLYMVKDMQYYNFSGQRINSPSGLTIVVTRYSDGSVRIEKRLF